MQRYNIFFPVHKGLRALLFETALQLQQTDFTDREQSERAVEEVKQVVDLFEGHAHKEDHYIFAALAAYEPSVVCTFEQEHAEDHELGESLQNWLTALGYAQADGARQAMGNELSKAFIDFAAFNLRHMAKEEKVINPLLWRYYTDQELQGITQKVVATLTPAENAVMSRWMVKGMSNGEIAGWLQGVRNGAPPPVFAALLALTEENLPTGRWNNVREVLTEGAMVA